MFFNKKKTPTFFFPSEFVAAWRKVRLRLKEHLEKENSHFSARREKVLRDRILRFSSSKRESRQRKRKREREFFFISFSRESMFRNDKHF